MRSKVQLTDALEVAAGCSADTVFDMKPHLWRHVVALGVLVLSGYVHAQDTCPSGKYRATPRGIPGPVVCAPIAHDRDGHVVAPPPRADQWGAIASDVAANHVATSANHPNKQEAEEAALASCSLDGGAGCSVAIAYGNGCGALVAGERGLSAGADVTKEFARQAAMHQCSSNGEQRCHVVHVACSAPSFDH